MTRPAATNIGLAAPQSSPADRWISRAAAATVAALAGVAGAISYSHMRQLAQDHGQTGWHAHAFPLSVDGIEIVASLVLLADHRHGRRSGWLPWTALMIGTAGSLAANIATAGPGPTSRVIAGWPALALLIAVKLLSSMLGRHEIPGQAAAISFRRAGAPTHLLGHRTPSPLRSTRRPQAPATSPTVPGPDPDLTALLPAARDARDELQRAGRSLTRDALAAGLRRHGHPIRNARVSPLLQLLRQEEC